MHFTFDGQVYKQVDGVCMGSPLGPILANVFMVQLEEDVAPRLESIMPIWKRYVDDAFTFVKKNHISTVIDEINSINPNIKFNHETEDNNSIAFLDVLLTKQEEGTIETSVYRSIYIHCNSLQQYIQQQYIHPLQSVWSSTVENGYSCWNFMTSVSNMLNTSK